MASAEPLMHLDCVRRHFGGLTAVNDVTLDFYPHSVYAIIGPNGAGKTTLFGLMSGAVRPTSGRVVYEGRDVAGLAVHSIARLGIIRKFQTPRVFGSLTVLQNLLVAASSVDRYGHQRERRANEILEMIGLEGRMNEPAGALSHGEKQQLEVGMALMTKPSLLLLDEPSSGMDIQETHRTSRLVRDLGENLTVVVIDHDMQFVRDLNCEVIVLHQGAVLRRGSMGEIESDHVVRDVYLGRARNA